MKTGAYQDCFTMKTGTRRQVINVHNLKKDKYKTQGDK
jgi:hypothetical protein